MVAGADLEANKDRARRLRLAPNTGDLAVLDELATPDLAATMREHITAMRVAFSDVRYEIDFRSVYARVLDQWLGVNSVPILNGDFRAGAPAIF